jgi:hypothetical protein
MEENEIEKLRKQAVGSPRGASNALGVGSAETTKEQRPGVLDGKEKAIKALPLSTE